MHIRLLPNTTEYPLGNLDRRGPCYGHICQAVDVLGRVLPRQRRKRDPSHPPWNATLDYPFVIHSGRLIVNHVCLVDPADVQVLA